MKTSAVALVSVLAGVLAGVVAGRTVWLVRAQRRENAEYWRRRDLENAAVAAWSETVLPDGSGPWGWAHIARWAAETATEAGLDTEAVSYAARVGLLPPYDKALDPVTLETHRHTDLAALFAWAPVAARVEDWMLWHRAGMSPAETLRFAALPDTDPDKPTRQTLLTLSALLPAPSVTPIPYP